MKPKRLLSFHQQNYEPSKCSKILLFNTATARKRTRNNKLECIKDVSEIWHHHLEDGSVPGSLKTNDEQLHSKDVAYFRHLHPQS